MPLSSHLLQFFRKVGSLGLKVQQVWHILDNVLDADSEVSTILRLQEKVNCLLVAQTEKGEVAKSGWQLPVDVLEQAAEVDTFLLLDRSHPDVAGFALFALFLALSLQLFEYFFELGQMSLKDADDVLEELLGVVCKVRTGQD